MNDAALLMLKSRVAAVVPCRLSKIASTWLSAASTVSAEVALTEMLLSDSYPDSVSWTAVAGASTRSSWFSGPALPFAVRIPITVNALPFRSMLWLSRLLPSPPASSFATSTPTSATRECAV